MANYTEKAIFSGDRIGSAGSGEWNEGSVYAIFKDGRFGRIENSGSDQQD